MLVHRFLNRVMSRISTREIKMNSNLGIQSLTIKLVSLTLGSVMHPIIFVIRQKNDAFQF